MCLLDYKELVWAGGFRVFFLCLKAFFYLLMWVKVFAPHQVWIVKTQVVIKHPPVPQTSLLENEQTFKNK